MTKRRALLGLLTLVPIGAFLVSTQSRATPVPPLAPPAQALQVYHLGHSLVGPVMPHMLAQLAPEGHQWNSQLGSGTSLKEHWEPDQPIRDFEISNNPPAYREAREAVGSGDYDAVVLTEMVELRDAIKYFGSAKYMRRWADLARNAPKPPRIYLYETWHNLDDADGWLERIDGDLDPLWLKKLLGPDSRRNADHPVYLIPAGQVMAAVVRAAETGGIPGLTARSELFTDTIHLNDLGAYVVALTHYAVLYHKSPEGLAHQLTLPDGTAAQAFDQATAEAVQKIVWATVTTFDRTGLTQAE
ncbi:hypothetical protein GFB49_12460 [Epibacterium sp. SM1979]|uniref:SGNH/GDSL hydrolase family protein n=1 Tax=Tritonibacter litoralis TaxID=2662264 RepID=A0A843YED6_9RHOB|nr:hypothetical protein [Tritonibacter litoralis]MQQ09271.1 hypothetical protein [Tritonibacter litoralis]